MFGILELLDRADRKLNRWLPTVSSPNCPTSCVVCISGPLLPGHPLFSSVHGTLYP